MKRFLSLFLTVTMLVSLLPTMALPFSAEEVTLGTVGKVSDPSTIDQWESFIGPDNKSTVNAGAVWMDKSVFADTTALDDIKTSVRGYPLSTNVIDKDNNFLVSMSAIASNKSIVGYSHIPTDTMLILDVSASMSDANAQTMVNEIGRAHV